MIIKGWTKQVLDRGYLKLIDFMGSDENIVEAARMSTGKGFFSWFWEKDTYADMICLDCRTQHLREELPLDDDSGEPLCTTCWGQVVSSINDENIQALTQERPKLKGIKGQPRDLSLLEFLMANRHATPFEMGEIVIEVKAPIMVFREWHRHRTQSYNEFSARYAQMPNHHYVPSLERVQKQSKTNKQGSGDAFPEAFATEAISDLRNEQEQVYQNYDRLVRAGVAKEVARINTPVARYSRMRAKTDVRNWLGFLSLRMERSAQWEIQQYALAVAKIIHEIFPRTYEMFLEHEFLAVRFSRTEMRVLRRLLTNMPIDDAALDGKKLKALTLKVTEDKEKAYAHVPGVGDPSQL